MPTPNERQGTFAEEYIADEYGLEHRPDETHWFDCVDPSTGTKYEVKSTTTEYSGEYSEGATGRFRLWLDQHRSLVAAQASEDQTAYYAFVLLDTNGKIEDVARRRPTTVTKIVDGDWNRADHADRDSRQHKVPWYEVYYP